MSTRKQECLYCHHKYRITDNYGRLLRHKHRGKTCEGSYFPGTWHSRQLELLAMMKRLAAC